MPRQPRHYLPGVACHVIQRGNNRQPCFSTDTDRLLYLEWLREASGRCRCDVHAYVLMTNHVHVLVTPAEVESVPRMMQSLGRRYVRYFNDRHQRTGTLWEGRHKASLVDSDNYFLTCARYIELNPVRAGLAAHPADYRWSSYRANAEGRDDKLLTAHAIYVALAPDASSRQQAYRHLFDVETDATALAQIRLAAKLGVPLGSESFKEEVDRWLKAPVSYRPRGRPATRAAPAHSQPTPAPFVSENDSDPF